MVFVRSVVEVKYGHFGEVARSFEELNEICRARGWKPAQLRMLSGGPANIITADVEYESLAQWEAEQDAAYGDPEFMKVLRSSTEYCVQGTAREEIWMDLPHLA